MASRVIAIPGDEGTSVSEGPILAINGVAQAPMTIEIKYNARAKNEGSPLCGIVTFHWVVQFRWVKFGFSRQLGNPEDLRFGLLEILDSELIEGMRSAHPVQAFELADVHHYRMSWNHWGTIDILARNVETAESNEECP